MRAPPFSFWGACETRTGMLHGHPSGGSLAANARPAPGRGAEGAMAARQDRPFCDALTTAAGSACETLAQEDPRPHPDAGLPPA